MTPHNPHLPRELWGGVESERELTPVVSYLGSKLRITTSALENYCTNSDRLPIDRYSVPRCQLECGTRDIQYHEIQHLRSSLIDRSCIAEPWGVAGSGICSYWLSNHICYSRSHRYPTGPYSQRICIDSQLSDYYAMNKLGSVVAGPQHTVLQDILTVQLNERPASWPPIEYISAHSQ